MSERFPVLLVHGLGDHSQALPYRRLTEALAQWPLHVAAYDQRGHGTRRDEFPFRWVDLLDDLDARRRAMAADHGIEPALIGLSMGALLALDLAVAGRAGTSRVVAAAAPVGPIGASRVAILAGRWLGRWLPQVPIRPALDTTAIATDQALVHDYISDPLFHQELCAGLAGDLLAARDRVLARAAGLANDVLMLHGTDDRIAVWDGAFAARTPSGRCRVRLFSTARHNLWLEPAVTDAASAIGAFLLAPS